MITKKTDLVNLLDRIRPKTQPDFPSGSRVGRLFFFLAIVVITGISASLVLFPTLERSIPIEADDSYGRIAHAVRLQECFDQKCPALKDIRTQLDEVEGPLPNTSNLFRVGNRALTVAYTWHSAALLFLSKLGLSLELSHGLLAIIASVVMVAGTGYWLWSLFGPGAAGFVILLVASQSLYRWGAGLPYEFVLGLTFITWAEIRRRGPKSAGLMAIMLFLMLGWHVGGKIWASVTLLVFLWHIRQPLGQSEKRWLALSVLFILAAFIAPTITPPFSGGGQSGGCSNCWALQPIPGLSFSELENLFGLVIWNLSPLAPLLLSWLNFFGGMLYAVTLFFLGIFLISSQERRENLFWMALFGVLIALATLHHSPGYPGNLLGRIWVINAIFLTGLSGYGLVHGLNIVCRMVKKSYTEETNIIDGSSKPFLLAFMLAFSLSVLDQIVFMGSEFFSSISHSIEYRIQRHNYDLSITQPEKFVRSAETCGRILHDNDTLPFFYLSHGAYACGVALLTPKIDEQNIDAWLSTREITHYATWGPFHKQRGNLWISGNAPLTIRIDQSVSPGDLRIKLLNSTNNRPVMLQKPPLSGRKSALVKFYPDNLGWITVDKIEQFAGKRLELYPFGKDKVEVSHILAGSGKQGNLRWPWDMGITLEGRYGGKEYQYSLKSNALLPGSKRKIKIIDDKGSSILATVN